MAEMGNRRFGIGTPNGGVIWGGGLLVCGSGLIARMRPAFTHCAIFAAWSRFAAVGRLAQWLARLLYTQLVGGSSPSAPTTFFHH